MGTDVTIKTIDSNRCYLLKLPVCHKCIIRCMSQSFIIIYLIRKDVTTHKAFSTLSSTSAPSNGVKNKNILKNHLRTIRWRWSKAPRLSQMYIGRGTKGRRQKARGRGLLEANFINQYRKYNQIIYGSITLFSTYI